MRNFEGFQPMQMNVAPAAQVAQAAQAVGQAQNALNENAVELQNAANGAHMIIGANELVLRNLRRRN